MILKQSRSRIEFLRGAAFPRIVAVVVILFLISSCDRPETIGRNELKRIFKEAFLVNAYYEENKADVISRDSLDVYRPILARHGYDVEDMEYTVSNYARKKSSSLSRIVDQAVAELKSESAYYNGMLAERDSLYAKAARILRREVLWRDSIVVRRVADTAKLRVRIPAEEGAYEISYSYLVDTLDKNRILRMTFGFVDSMGSLRNPDTEYILRRGIRQRPEVFGLNTNDDELPLL